MKIGVAGTEYVGLVHGVSSDEKSHRVNCVDIYEGKSAMPKSVRTPFDNGRQHFLTNPLFDHSSTEIIFISESTPEEPDKSVYLHIIKKGIFSIAQFIENDVVASLNRSELAGKNNQVSFIIEGKKPPDQL